MGLRVCPKKKQQIRLHPERDWPAMLLVQFSFPKADKMKCFLMFESVEFFVRCYCRRWVRRGLCRTSGARAVNVADPLAGRGPCCCCCCSTHKTKNSHTWLLAG